ncbi:hypothetical protein HA402_013689 [Bradysia odoriphaga]|nr:hypothetical protein HA402_013689 [Bradysia odoriphaga]
MKLKTSKKSGKAVSVSGDFAVETVEAESKSPDGKKLSKKLKAVGLNGSSKINKLSMKAANGLASSSKKLSKESKVVNGNGGKKKLSKKSKASELMVEESEEEQVIEDEEHVSGKSKKKKKVRKTDDVPGVKDNKASKELKAVNGKSKKSKSSELMPEVSDQDNEDTEEISEKSKKKKKSKGADGAKVVKDHKASLSNLKTTDPEFYKFLKENDRKLLNFEADNDGEGDSESEKEPDEPMSDEDDDNDESVHKPNETLEAASDESDFEEQNNEDEEESPAAGRSITLKMLKQWQMDLNDEKVKADTIKNVILAVNSALMSVAGEDMNAAAYKVEGTAVFNGILQLCVLHLHPAVLRFLGLTSRTSIKPHKCKKWKKVRTSMRGYFIDLTKLLEHISSANILIVLLKHLHQISPMISSFSNMTKPILKRLVTLWSTSDETVRVLAFLCILKITRGLPISFLNVILKAMYLSYVRNSKFVSPGTLPGINFMRRSLTEMFALDLNVSYQHVFLYIRQLAIHLRNALTLKKKDSFQSVYNWQFINSMRLWAELLSATNNKTQLQPLIYPLVSIITGVIKLIPTAQFFPLRFHCIQILIQLSKETRCFIPTLPFILEVLNSNTFNKKHSKVSMKPLSFTCILRLNKPQMLENGFRDEVVQNIFDLTLEYMANESYSLSYPELAVPCIINLKQYIKKRCKNSNYTRKLKQLVEKLEENSKFVEAEREKINFTLKDTQLITAWETTLKNKGTPLLTYYNNWVKTNFTKKKRQAIQSEDINDYDMPSIKRKAPGTQKPAQDGPVELFPSDDENDDLEVEKQPPAKKAKKEKKAIEQVATEMEEDDDDDFNDDGVDIVKDLDLDDW